MKQLSLFLTTILLTVALSTVAHASLRFSMASAGNDTSYSYWNMTYTFHNSTVETATELNLYFDATLFALIDPPDLKANWSTAAYNGPFSGTGGVPYDSYIFYNAIAIGAGIAPAGSDTFTFRVGYQGLPGGELPQAQPYQVMYYIADTPVVLEAGIATVAEATAVPEPSTCLLLTLGLGVIAVVRRKL